MLDLENLIRRDILTINLHLPKRRIPLSKLISMEEPLVELKNGDFHYFRRAELELLLSLSDNPEYLMLPIVIEISSRYRGYFMVRGMEECRVIVKILRDECTFLEENTVLCPRYLLPRLRRLLATATTYAFVGV